MKQPARIGRDRFQIAPLRLGIERPEGERRLAGAGNAREHDESIARNVDVDILEIVLARAADPDIAIVQIRFPLSRHPPFQASAGSARDGAERRSKA